MRPVKEVNPDSRQPNFGLFKHAPLPGLSIPLKTYEQTARHWSRHNPATYFPWEEDLVASSPPA